MGYFRPNYQHPFGYCESLVHVFKLFNHYFYKKLSLYTHIPNIHLWLGFEFLPQRFSHRVLVIRASKPVQQNRRSVLSSYCSNIYTENLGKMAHMVEEVRDALLDDPEPQSPNGQPKQWSKFDKLLSSIHPLIVVREN